MKKEDGLYLFGLRTDDGSLLWIDDKMIIKNEADGKYHFQLNTPMNLAMDSAYLREGECKVEIWYCQAYPDRMGCSLNQKS